MFAIIPGVSRSGSTITAGRALRLTREGAAVFSFLMSMPIIAAASMLKVPHVAQDRGTERDARRRRRWRRRSAAGSRSRCCCASSSQRSYGVFAAYRVVRRSDRPRHCLQPLIARRRRRRRRALRRRDRRASSRDDSAFRASSRSTGVVDARRRARAGGGRSRRRARSSLPTRRRRGADDRDGRGSRSPAPASG